MLYRTNPKTDDKISTLAYGCMRFPEKHGKIDIKKSEPLLYLAYEKGVNYYDTAYPYHGGQSESFVGDFFYNTKLRDKVKIATKLPVWSVNTHDDMYTIFAKQKHKLKTHYINYYLLHALNGASWDKVYNLGVLDFLDNLKKEGEILNAGFSFHGKYDDFLRIVDSYDWDFCQIQFNYLDIKHQAGLDGLNYASSKNMAIMIMEPLRGGTLASVPSEINKIFNKSNPNYTPAKWALKWILNHPSVTTILSGMSKTSDVEENCNIMSEEKPLSQSELDTVINVREKYLTLMEIPCTVCNYCMPCPRGVNIPVCFDLYNTKHVFNHPMHANIMYAQMINGVLGTYASPSLCVECGLCETKCPQNIKIIKSLKKVKKSFESLKMKLFFKIIKIVLYFQKLINKFKKAK